MGSPVEDAARDGDIIDFTTKELSKNLQSYLSMRNTFEYAHEKAKKKLGIQTACRAACTWCCTHDQPAITPAEACALIELCARNPALTDVLDRALKQWKWVTDKAAEPNPTEQVGHPMMRCIFLGDNGRCRIYKQRPVPCVGTFSSDAAACAASAADKTRTAWTVDRGLMQQIVRKMAQYLSPEKLQHLLEWLQAKTEDGETMPLNMGVGLMLERNLKAQGQMK